MAEAMIFFKNSNGVLDIKDHVVLKRCGLIHANLLRVWEKIEFLTHLLDFAFCQVCEAEYSSYINLNSISDQKKTIKDMVEEASSYLQVSSKVIQHITGVSNGDIQLEGEGISSFARTIQKFHRYQHQTRDLLLDITKKCTDLYMLLYQIRQSIP